MKNRNVMVRREQAGQEVKKQRKKLDQISYEVKDGDIIVLSGPYLGKSVKDMWSVGPIERDYIVKHLWFTNDFEVVKIINHLCV
jgi:ABC-type iron transport system FetAB ATPase subunit